MQFCTSQALIVRIRRDLPATTPLPMFMQMLMSRWFPLSYLKLCRVLYGNKFTLYPIGMAPLVFLSDPAVVRATLMTSPTVLHPGAGGVAISPIVGRGSFMLRDDDVHTSGRKAVTPALQRRVVQEHSDAIAKIVACEVEAWPLDEGFPLRPRLQALTLAIIMRTVFGEETSALQALHSQILAMLSVTTTFLLQQPRLRHLPGWRRTWRVFLRRRHEVDALIATLIARARREGAPEGTVLDLLLRAHNADGSPMSDKQVRDHLMSVILAGHETTASELAWAFQLLAHNPRVQERLIEEIDEQGGEDGQSGEYLTATVQEVLRHRPVFLFAIPRVVAKPIEIGGWTYKPPAQLLGCIYLVHHDPDLYSDPHEFRPERFLGSPPDPRTWLPWGGGRKRCPGHHLAMLEMQTVLRATLATRTILPAGRRMEHARWRSVIVTPHAGSRVILRRRRRPGR
jgi:cytochrome P450